MNTRITKAQKLLSLGLVLLVSTTACRSSKISVVESASVDSTSSEVLTVEKSEAGLNVLPDVRTDVVAPAPTETAAVVVDSVTQTATPEAPGITETQPVERVLPGIGLASDGFNLFVGDGSGTSRLKFGSDMSTVADLLSRVWGEPSYVSEDTLCEPSNQRFDAVVWPLMVGTANL